MKSLSALLAILVLATGALWADGRDTTLRTRDGSPLCGFYYFTHWWEPWTSDDARIARDLREIKAMGCNTLFLDSEFTQMLNGFDGRWSLLDRGHRLAKEAGLEILPWMSLMEWIDLGTPEQIALIKDMYGVELKMGVDYEGNPNRLLVYDEATIEAGYRYCVDYLERYLKDGAILHIRDGGKLKPVIAISVELNWAGSNDKTTNQMFASFLKEKYGDVKSLNKAWKTRLESIDEIECLDPELFDPQKYLEKKTRHPRAMEDQIAFRAKVQNDSMGEIGRRLKAKYPDLLIAAELPYEMFSEHPHAIGFRIYGAHTPEATLHADITVLRCTGCLSERIENALVKWQKDTGRHLVITYRTYRGIADLILQEENTDYHGIGAQAARIGDGFGFYSWNEMVDTHIAAEPDLEHPYGAFFMNKEQQDAWRALACQQIREYRSVAK